MKYYLIAGEASGDLHGANLMKAILKEDPQADFRFWGGDKMKAVSQNIAKHYKDLAFMGFLEVLLNLKTILKNIKFCKEDILKFQPDVIIFIDYPGFNMRIANWAKKQNIPTHYYISPKIWAWKESRIKAIKRDIDKMYVIFPFEEDFYQKKHHYPVHFVGNPLIDEISQTPLLSKEAFFKENHLDHRPKIALLPGSRQQEIEKMLSVMLSVQDDFPDYQFVIAGAPSQDFEFYSKFINHKNVAFVSGKTYNLLSCSTASLVTSGTATLETALFNIPQVVCYSGNWLTYQIAKRLIKLKFISLVNLILNKEAVCELIQDDFNKNRLKEELQKILDPKKRQEIFEDYKILHQKLAGKGASERVAKILISEIKKLQLLK